VAHDLKNPLNNIMGYAELLMRRTRLDEQTVDDITHSIYEGGAKMNDIIDSLLLLAGVRKQVVELGPVDMALVVDEVLRREQFEIEQAQARIVMPESWPKTIGYAPWVELVWINYISNAIKYGGEPPRVELEAVPFSDGRMVRFQVTDNGAGLSAEEMTQLFKPFVRLQKERASGHGLGLTIVDRIATRLGGTVGVESMRGRGSTFYFTLPAA
jgi:signal transduction histidine kinase